MHGETSTTIHNSGEKCVQYATSIAKDLQQRANMGLLH